jgi:hypothetical protein
VANHHRRQSVEIGHRAAVHRLVEGEEARLMTQQLAHGDLVLAVLGELGPVGRDPLVVVQPAARVGDGQRHRRKTLGRGMDYHHRVALPRLVRLLVADAAPEIDDLLAEVVRRARAAQFSAAGEVLLEHLADDLEAATDVTLDAVCRCDGSHDASAVARRQLTGSH